LFSACYVGLAAVVVGCWLVAPTAFLCGFLIASAWHFGGDPAAGTSGPARVLYGGAVIVLPALVHGTELQHLLGLVAGPAGAAAVAPVLGQLAPPWLAATLWLAVRQARASPLAACEWAALVALAVVAPPLAAFSVYFCAMHSPRHILKTLAGLPAAQVRQAWALALWPALAVLVAVLLAALVASLVATGLLGKLATPLPVEGAVMQIVFVGLAALTLPHMLLIERARRIARAGVHPI
jgi:beta-carotene 15,15'-dioxygenase